MHLKVFLKLKKTLKTLSSGQVYKNPQKTQKTPKTQKKPTGLGFLKKPAFFPTLAEGGAGAAVRRCDGDGARGAGTEGRRFRLQSQPSLSLGHCPAETQVSDCQGKLDSIHLFCACPENRRWYGTVPSYLVAALML
jgi:hypothetical protein